MTDEDDAILWHRVVQEMQLLVLRVAMRRARVLMSCVCVCVFFTICYFSPLLKALLFLVSQGLPALLAGKKM